MDNQDITVNFDEAKWGAMWQRMRGLGVAFSGQQAQRALDNSIQLTKTTAQGLVKRITGALREAITTKTRRIKGPNSSYVLWGGIGIKSKSVFVTQKGKVQRPPNYYFIIEKGRVSNEQRENNSIASRINPNRRKYINRVKDLASTKKPFLVPAIKSTAGAVINQLATNFEKLIDKEAAKIAL